MDVDARQTPDHLTRGVTRHPSVASSVAEDDLGRLRAELLQRGPLPLGRCEELIREGQFPRGELLARIPENLIRIDLHAPISGDTIIHVCI